MTEAIAPVAAPERISSVDVLRGVALLGILLMNIVSFGLPWHAYMNPTVAGGAAGRDLWTWLVSQVLFEGKMRALFSMLFGAGVILFTSRAEARDPAAAADLYYRRTLWLLAFGILHAYFLWAGDILYSYAVVGLMLYPLRHCSARALMVAGVCMLAALVPKNILRAQEIVDLRSAAARAEAGRNAGKQLTEEQKSDLRRWEEKRKELKPDKKAIDEEIAGHRAGYLSNFLRRAGEASAVESVYFYQFIFFDVCGMMLIGMGLMKSGVLAAQRSTGFYARMALAGYGAGIPVMAYICRRDIAAGFELGTLKYGFTGYDAGRLAVALGHAAVVVLICKTGALAPARRALAAVGQMALTNYLLTSVLCTFFFNGYGLGMYGRLSRFELLYVVAGVWAVILTVSPRWLGRYRYGPMEWVWRSLTYGRKQPMKIPEAAAAGVAQAAP